MPSAGIWRTQATSFVLDEMEVSPPPALSTMTARRRFHFIQFAAGNVSPGAARAA
jgi:hypothetical protein